MQIEAPRSKLTRNLRSFLVILRVRLPSSKQTENRGRKDESGEANSLTGLKKRPKNAELNAVYKVFHSIPYFNISNLRNNIRQLHLEQMFL